MKSLKGKALGSVWACLRIVYREGIRGYGEGWFTPGSSVAHEAPVGALLLGRASQHRFACVGDRKAGAWKAA